MDTSGSRSEIPGKGCNVVLEEAGEDKMDRSCEGSFTKNEEERNNLHTVKRWKANSIGHILRRNCLSSSNTRY